MSAAAARTGTLCGFALLAGVHAASANEPVDISGDGHANEGFQPGRVRDYAVHSGVTVNGLALINDKPYLEDYYRRNVIGGVGAFVMVAIDYSDFIAAIQRKLLQEQTAGPIAGAPVPAGAG